MAHWAAVPQREAGRPAHAGFRLINRLIGPWRPQARVEREELLAGLLAQPAAIPPKYFYDALGCALFEAICELPEYYLTRTERAIFAAHRETIAAVVGSQRQFVDLGAGDCRKGESWLTALQPRRFIAVDIAPAALEPALARLAAAHPDIEFTGVVTDFSRTLDLGAELDAGPVTFFYPGSSIGNFAPDEALELLAQIRRLCDRRGGLLIGVDAPKDEARRAHCVTLGGRERVFAPGERIHTENSYKYTPEQFASMLRRAGFAEIAVWQDESGDFAVYYAE